jgi:hypothetical protein
MNKFLSGYLKGGDHLEDLGVDGNLTLEWILWKYNGRVITG